MFSMKNKILITEAEIKARTMRVSMEIDESYSSEIHDVHAVCVLKGSYMFYSDLMKNLSGITNRNYFTEFIKCSSYSGTETSGKVQFQYISFDPNGKDILLVEDIIDTGITLQYLKQYLIERGAKSVRVVTLLNKCGRRLVDMKPDHYCFSVGPNDFVIGYGMDYNELYRSLPYVGLCIQEESI